MKKALFCLLTSCMALTSCKAVAASAIAYKNTGNEFLGTVFIAVILTALTTYLPYRFALSVLADDKSRVKEAGSSMAYGLSFFALIIELIGLLSEGFAGILYLVLLIGLCIAQKREFNFTWGKSIGVLLLFLVSSWVISSIIDALIAG